MTTDNQPALLPCPFCGGQVDFESTTDVLDDCNAVCCAECDFSLMGGPVGIGWWPTRQAAADTWNRRAEGATLGEGLPKGVSEALQRMIEDGLIRGEASAEDARLLIQWRGQFIATPTTQRVAAGDEPMTVQQVEQWIGACNHEPARKVLREYLALRFTTTPPPTGSVAVGDVAKALQRDIDTHGHAEIRQAELDAILATPPPTGEAVAWQRLERWLGTWADSIPTQAYHELCSLQSDLRHHPAAQAEGRGVTDEMVERACRAIAAAGPGEDRHYLVSREVVRTALAASLSAIPSGAPNGYALVPIEPTYEALRAMVLAWNTSDEDTAEADMAIVWRNAVAAAVARAGRWR